MKLRIYTIVYSGIENSRTTERINFCCINIDMAKKKKKICRVCLLKKINTSKRPVSTAIKLILAFSNRSTKLKEYADLSLLISESRQNQLPNQKAWYNKVITTQILLVLYLRMLD